MIYTHQKHDELDEQFKVEKMLETSKVKRMSIDSNITSSMLSTIKEKGTTTEKNEDVKPIERKER